MLDMPVPDVKQQWAWIVLGWETLQRISGSADTPKGSLSNACIGSLSSLWCYLSKNTYETTYEAAIYAMANPDQPQFSNNLMSLVCYSSLIYTCFNILDILHYLE